METHPKGGWPGWLNVDLFWPEVSAYGYVSNQPNSYADPTGLLHDGKCPPECKGCEPAGVHGIPGGKRRHCECMGFGGSVECDRYYICGANNIIDFLKRRGLPIDDGGGFGLGDVSMGITLIGGALGVWGAIGGSAAVGTGGAVVGLGSCLASSLSMYLDQVKDWSNRKHSLQVEGPIQCLNQSGTCMCFEESSIYYPNPDGFGHQVFVFKCCDGYGPFSKRLDVPL